MKAIIPWEGFADLYRDALFHGGLLSLFMPNWFMAHMMHHLVGRASRHYPNAWQINTLHFWLQNSLDSGAFRGSQAQWDKITVPLFSVGNWSGMALHLRGNTEAFMRAATPHKKLRIHAGTHVHPFYSEEGRRDQLRFFDYWLKDIDNGVMDEPPVKLAIRKGRDEIEWRHEHEWPLKRTQWTKFYFDLSNRKSRLRHGRAHLRQSRPGERVELSGNRARLHGFDLGRILAGDGRRHPAGYGSIAGDRAACAGCGSNRTGCSGSLGCELDRGHGPLSHPPQHR